jgi:DNA-binding MarR family transcriptional regulator
MTGAPHTGVGRVQRLIINSLISDPEREWFYTHEIVRRTRATSGSVRGSLAALESVGAVEKRPDPNNSRWRQWRVKRTKENAA